MCENSHIIQAFEIIRALTASPAQSPELPAQSPELPAQSPELPGQSAGLRAQSTPDPLPPYNPPPTHHTHTHTPTTPRGR